MATEMLALSELNRSTEPPALTAGSSVAKPIADDDCADIRLATRARTSAPDTKILDATTVASTAPAVMSPPADAETEPALGQRCR